jgi:hypothetical protein
LRDIKHIRLGKLVEFSKIWPQGSSYCVWLELAAGIGIDLYCGVWITDVKQVLYVELEEVHRTFS